MKGPPSIGSPQPVSSVSRAGKNAGRGEKQRQANRYHFSALLGTAIVSRRGLVTEAIITQHECLQAIVVTEKWRARRDLNARPLAPEASALSN